MSNEQELSILPCQSICGQRFATDSERLSHEERCPFCLSASPPLSDDERSELEPLRMLVCELETNCDPSSNVRDIVTLRENCKSLESELAQARAEVAEAKAALDRHLRRQGVALGRAHGMTRLELETEFANECACVVFWQQRAEAAEAERDRLVDRMERLAKDYDKRADENNQRSNHTLDSEKYTQAITAKAIYSSAAKEVRRIVAPQAEHPQ